jgi:hypothetical protein
MNLITVCVLADVKLWMGLLNFACKVVQSGLSLL